MVEEDFKFRMQNILLKNLNKAGCIRFLFYILSFLAIITFNAFGQSKKYNEDVQPIKSEQKIAVPTPIGYVNDFEGIFDVEQERGLDSLIKDFEEKTTIEIAVVTLDSSMTNKANFDQFTLNLANEWGVGKKDRDNGILIGISASLHSIKIQNGYGIEKMLTNEETKNLIDTVFISNFRNGNYFEGIRKGILGLIDKLNK